MKIVDNMMKPVVSSINTHLRNENIWTASAVAVMRRAPWTRIQLCAAEVPWAKRLTYRRRSCSNHRRSSGSYVIRTCNNEIHRLLFMHPFINSFISLYWRILYQFIVSEWSTLRDIHIYMDKMYAKIMWISQRFCTLRPGSSLTTLRMSSALNVPI